MEIHPTTPNESTLSNTELIPREDNSEIWEQVRAETLPIILPSSKKMNGTELHAASDGAMQSAPTGELPDEQSKIDRILHLLATASSDSNKRTIYFGPSGWGGFGNGFRAIRGLALYAVLFQVKLRCR